MWFLLRHFALACVLMLPGLSFGAVKGYKVEHSPPQPKSGEAVRITASGKGFAGQKNLTLQYQFVEPGNYIELRDPAYTNHWESVPMSHSGGEIAKKSTVFTAV